MPLRNAPLSFYRDTNFLSLERLRGGRFVVALDSIQRWLLHVTCSNSNCFAIVFSLPYIKYAYFLVADNFTANWRFMNRSQQTVNVSQQTVKCPQQTLNPSQHGSFYSVLSDEFRNSSSRANFVFWKINIYTKNFIVHFQRRIERHFSFDLIREWK